MRKQLDELTLLANKYKCDKGSIKHNYTKIYDQYFSGIKNDKFKLLEMGFGKGASVKMWLGYFKNTCLYSVDINEFPKNFLSFNRLKCFIADQSSKEQMDKIYKNEEFRIIIDDGSHKTEDQQYTLGFSFKFVTPGGWYVIEDLKCKRSHNEKFKIKADKTLEVLQRYLKNKKFYSKVLTSEQNLYLNENIDNVKIYHDKIAFIKRGKHGNK